MSESSNKSAIRRVLRERVAALSDAEKHAQSLAACSLVAASPEFAAARCLMLYLSTPQEVETAPLALKAWQAGKTVVVPKVWWDQRRMLPMEINSLTQDLAPSKAGMLEPIAGKPVPVDLIDMVVVPGVGFTPRGFRIGRGMGFYDRFLAQSEFIGVSCGLAFEAQVLEDLPVLDHDMPLSMLATNRGIRRFASHCIER
jgi:5-formyltetrahydrofolate cyclo-ligase